MCVTKCVLVFQDILPETQPNSAAGRGGNGEQHVTDQCATVDSMLHLHRTLAFCLWCSLLLHNQAVADEEALWGPTPSRENSPEDKQNSSWWSKPIPSLPFHIPLNGGSDGNNEAVALTTTTKGLAEPNEHTQDISTSGDGSVLEAYEAPTTLTKGLLTSVTKTGSDSLPTVTSDSPHISTTWSNNDALVSDSYSPTSGSIRNSLFTNSPTSTSTPQQTATHTRPPWGNVRAAAPGMGVASRHLPGELSDTEESRNFTEKVYSTISPETTVPTALTWAASQTTTTIPRMAETPLTSRHPLGPVTPPKSSETMFISKPQYPTVSTTLRVREATVTETHASVAEAGSGPVEEHPGVITISVGINHKSVEESIKSTTPRQGVNVPVAGGKQS